jgi:hypothetical protein
MLLLPHTVRTFLSQTNEKKWKTIGVVSASHLLQLAIKPGVCAVCYGRSSRVPVLGVLVGDRLKTAHDECVLQVNGVIIHVQADPLVVMTFFLRRFKRHPTIKGLQFFVSPFDSRMLARLRFVEADIREKRYNHTHLCYSPLYTHPEAAKLGFVRMSRILTFQ